MPFPKSTIFFYVILIQSFILFGCTPNPDINWPAYLGDHNSSHFVNATEINRENVLNLQMAWIFDGGEADPENRSQIQCNPLVIDGVLYGSTASLKFVALDATDGELIWKYNPFGEEFKNYGMGVNRGLIYWESQDKIDRRLYFSAGPYLHCVNAENGKLAVRLGI